MGKQNNSSPDTIRGTSLGSTLLLSMAHLNTCVCDVMIGLFNLTDTRGAVVSGTSKWVLYAVLMVLTGPVGLLEGRAMFSKPMMNWISLYRAMPALVSMSALKVIPMLPVSTKRYWSSLAIVMDKPRATTSTQFSHERHGVSNHPHLEFFYVTPRRLSATPQYLQYQYCSLALSHRYKLGTRLCLSLCCLLCGLTWDPFY